MEEYIFGIRAVIEAIKAEKNIDKVFIQKTLQGQLSAELLKLLKEKNINFSFVPVQKLDKLTKKNHQGVIATIPPIEYTDFEELITSSTENGKNPIFLILDHLTDVRNIGAIIRTAECTGVSGVILPKKGVSITSDSVKTSAGAVFRVPICRVDNLVDAVYFMQGSGFQAIAATEKTNNLIYEVDLKNPLAIIMGSEDKGIAPNLLKIVDNKAKLPMFGEISSLNVSVACGVFLYEVVRQRL